MLNITFWTCFLPCFFLLLPLCLYIYRICINTYSLQNTSFIFLPTNEAHRVLDMRDQLLGRVKFKKYLEVCLPSNSVFSVQPKQDRAQAVPYFRLQHSVWSGLWRIDFGKWCVENIYSIFHQYFCYEVQLFFWCVAKDSSLVGTF